MILKKILETLGFCKPEIVDTTAIAKAMRRADAASFLHGRITTKAKKSALDAIDHYVSDDEPEKMSRDVESMRETLAAVAKRAGERKHW